MESLLPLGDQAVLVYCANESAAVCFAAAVRGARPAWLVDVVQAYTSVAVFFALDQAGHAEVAACLRRLQPVQESATAAIGRSYCIPCCYEMGPDLAQVADHLHLPAEEVIQQHLGIEYTVYAIGFCPGFPYLGYLPAALCGVPRLAEPRLRVEAGSVGLTGRQTGIYTEVRPGGWNLIGRTPLQLVHIEQGYFPLRTGDRVCFERIDERAFDRLLGQRLPEQGPASEISTRS